MLNNYQGVSVVSEVRRVTKKMDSKSMTSHALGRLADCRRTLQQSAAGGRHNRHLQSMTSCITQIRLRQSMCIYLWNNPAEFHPDAI